MVKVHLTSQVVKETVCQGGKSKTRIYDDTVKGLSLQVRSSGAKAFYLSYQNARGKTVEIKLADAADVTPAQARAKAEKLRAEIAMGNDPLEQKDLFRSVPRFRDFVQDKYLPFVKGYKRSWETDESLLRNHLLPAFGNRYMDEITKSDIIAVHHGRVAAGAAKSSANRLVVILRYIFNLARKWKTPGVGENPTKDIPLFEENNKRERFLTTEETRRLHDAMLSSPNRQLRYIVALLILTGARKREVLDAQWDQFDLQRQIWRIPKTKAGKARHVPLSDGALQVLSQVPRKDDSRYVFANPKTGKPYVSIFCSWDTARIQAGLPDVRIHDLRHSFASFLVNNGRSLYEVQKLLGHTQIKTTQRYAHLSQDTLLEAANSVSSCLPVLGGSPLSVGADDIPVVVNG